MKLLVTALLFATVMNLSLEDDMTFEPTRSTKSTQKPNHSIDQFPRPGHQGHGSPLEPQGKDNSQNLNGNNKGPLDFLLKLKPAPTKDSIPFPPNLPSIPKNKDIKIQSQATKDKVPFNLSHDDVPNEWSPFEGLDGSVDLSALLPQPSGQKKNSGNLPDSQKNKHNDKKPSNKNNDPKGNVFSFDLPTFQIPDTHKQHEESSFNFPLNLSLPQPSAPVANDFVDFELDESFAEFGSPVLFIHQSFDTIASAIESQKATVSLIYAAHKSEDCASGRSKILRLIFKICPINGKTYYYALQTNKLPQEPGIDKFLFTCNLNDILLVFNLKTIDESKIYAISSTLVEEFVTIASKKKETSKWNQQPTHHHKLSEVPKKKVPQGLDIKSMINDAMKNGKEALNQVLNSRQGIPIISEDNKSVKKKILIGSSNVSDLY